MNGNTENPQFRSNEEREAYNRKGYAELEKAKQDAEREVSKQVEQERIVLQFEFKDYRVIKEVFRQKGIASP